jgi:predicted dehydrogenase
MIGTGKAARYHLEVLEQIRGANVSCIVNRGGSDPSSLTERYRIPRCHVGIEKALAEGGFEAAIVAVTASSTFAVAKALLESKIPCLIEKPLGISVEEADALRACAARANITSAVAFNRRCYSSVLRAAKYVEALGHPYAIHVNSPERLAKIRNSEEPAVLARNRIVTNTCHSIDLFTVFAGDHEAVMSSGQVKYFDGMRVDYTGLINFRKGQLGMFSSHWSSPGDRVVTLYGRDYRLEINLSKNRLLAAHGKNVQTFRPSGTDRAFKAGVYLQDARFLAAALAGVPVGAPLATLEEAFETQRLAHALMDLEVHPDIGDRCSP